jgi:hypothetical protein
MRGGDSLPRPMPAVAPVTTAHWPYLRTSRAGHTRKRRAAASAAPLVSACASGACVPHVPPSTVESTHHTGTAAKAPPTASSTGTGTSATALPSPSHSGSVSHAACARVCTRAAVVRLRHCH